MRSIHPPAEDRRLFCDCIDALEPAFEQLLDRAEQAGWKRVDALRAVCVLIWRRVPDSALSDGEATNSQIAAA